MVESKMVGHEVEQQPQPVGVKFFAKFFQLRFTPRFASDGVIGDRERRPGELLLLPVWQRLVDRTTERRVREGRGAAARAGRPCTHEPDVCKTEVSPALELGVRYRAQRDAATQPRRQLAHPTSRVNFVNKRL